MSPEWLESKTNEELKHWIGYYEEELRMIRAELQRRLVNESL